MYMYTILSSLPFLYCTFLWMDAWMLEVVLSLSKEYVTYAETWVVDSLTGVKLIKLIKVIMSVNFCGVRSYSPRHE